MTEKKPLKHYLAKGMTSRSTHGMYVAQFGAPGETSKVVKSEDGRPTLYSVEQEAEIAAMYALIKRLNEPRAQASSDIGAAKPGRMSARELRNAVQILDLEPEMLAFIHGTSMKRVAGWLDGTEDVPHTVRVLLALLDGFDGAIDIAIEVTTESLQEIQARPIDRT